MSVPTTLQTWITALNPPSATLKKVLVILTVTAVLVVAIFLIVHVASTKSKYEVKGKQSPPGSSPPLKNSTVQIVGGSSSNSSSHSDTADDIQGMEGGDTKNGTAITQSGKLR